LFFSSLFSSLLLSKNKRYYVGLGVEPGNAGLQGSVDALLAWVQGHAKEDTKVAGIKSSFAILHDFMYVYCVWGERERVRERGG
jgi:hypothetical protein